MGGLELRSQNQYGLVCGLALTVILTTAVNIFAEVEEKIQETRDNLSDVERSYREGQAELFSLNKQIKESARRRHDLNMKLMEHEAEVRANAQDLDELESRTDSRRLRLNRRLRSIYQFKNRKGFEWIFSSKSPIELERNHRFFKKIAVEDYRALKQLIVDLKEVRRKRRSLEGMVGRLMKSQKAVRSQESQLQSQMQTRSMRLVELKKIKSTQMDQLKQLRSQVQDGQALNYAFFEKQGALSPPVTGRLVREFGAYVDSKDRFRLMHKGHFYEAGDGHPVKTVFDGKVVVAERVPGYDNMVLIEHGDNYYTVYAYLRKLYIRKGQPVFAGELLGTSGGRSPLFGRGVYFEIRHFADAIDPKPWLKDSEVKVAAQDSQGGER